MPAPAPSMDQDLDLDLESRSNLPTVTQAYGYTYNCNHPHTTTTTTTTASTTTTTSTRLRIHAWPDLEQFGWAKAYQTPAQAQLKPQPQPQPPPQPQPQAQLKSQPQPQPQAQKTPQAQQMQIPAAEAAETAVAKDDDDDGAATSPIPNHADAVEMHDRVIAPIHIPSAIATSAVTLTLPSLHTHAAGHTRTASTRLHPRRQQPSTSMHIHRATATTINITLSHHSTPALAPAPDSDPDPAGSPPPPPPPIEQELRSDSMFDVLPPTSPPPPPPPLPPSPPSPPALTTTISPLSVSHSPPSKHVSITTPSSDIIDAPDPHKSLAHVQAATNTDTSSVQLKHRANSRFDSSSGPAWHVEWTLDPVLHMLTDRAWFRASFGRISPSYQRLVYRCVLLLGSLSWCISVLLFQRDVSIGVNFGFMLFVLLVMSGTYGIHQLDRRLITMLPAKFEFWYLMFHGGLWCVAGAAAMTTRFSALFIVTFTMIVIGICARLFTVDAAPALPLFERIWSISTAMFVYIFIFAWGVFHQDQTDEDGKSKDWYGVETLCVGTICSDTRRLAYMGLTQLLYYCIRSIFHHFLDRIRAPGRSVLHTFQIPMSCKVMEREEYIQSIQITRELRRQQQQQQTLDIPAVDDRNSSVSSAFQIPDIAQRSRVESCAVVNMNNHNDTIFNLHNIDNNPQAHDNHHNIDDTKAINTNKIVRFTTFIENSILHKRGVNDPLTTVGHVTNYSYIIPFRPFHSIPWCCRVGRHLGYKIFCCIWTISVVLLDVIGAFKYIPLSVIYLLLLVLFLLIESTRFDINVARMLLKRFDVWLQWTAIIQFVIFNLAHNIPDGKYDNVAAPITTHIYYTVANILISCTDAGPAYPLSIRVMCLLVLFGNNWRLVLYEWLHVMPPSQQHMCIAHLCAQYRQLKLAALITVILFQFRYLLSLLRNHHHCIVLSMPIAYTIHETNIDQQPSQPQYTAAEEHHQKKHQGHISATASQYQDGDRDGNGNGNGNGEETPIHIEMSLNENLSSGRAHVPSVTHIGRLRRKSLQHLHQDRMAHELNIA